MNMSLIISLFTRRLLSITRGKLLSFLFTALAGFIVFPGNYTFGQGNLLITPRRVVFEGSKRSMDLNLANTGQDSATYAISIIQIRMKEDGGFETITEPDANQRFADRFVRFFPRQVTLAPNEAQAVKIQLVRSNELTEGEYRSHFYFRAIPKPTALGAEEAVRDSTTISVRLTPVFGITIPIIIRSGASTAKASLSDLSFSMVNDTLPVVKMVFNRVGNMSVYGDLTVDHVSATGKKSRVGVANGVAVYTPNALRHFSLTLNRLSGVDFRSGKLIVTYSASSDVKPGKIDEAEVTLGR
jgi:P pilus assembly chaperone PapD